MSGNGTIHAIAIQPNGQCIIGGGFSHYNGLPQPRLARLDSNGTLDESFAIGTGAGQLCP
ncbi:MAG: delta-60 repeat domain-containing protein [Flavobacteriales bacterium]|nr:delta-60 repeat domain-containing protein [Flavobacteriales bacterium]